MADAFDIEMALIKANWDSGRYASSVDALEACVRYSRPLPAWLAQTAEAALRYSYAHGGSEGRGKHGGYRARDRRYLVDWTRWATADGALRHRALLPDWGFAATRDGAFEHASTQLRGTRYQGSPSAVKASYERIVRSKRRLGYSAD